MVRFRTEDIAEATHQHIEFGDAGQARCKAAVDDRLLRIGKNNIWPLPPDQPHIGPQRAQVIEGVGSRPRSEEHTSERQSLMCISYAVFCLKNKHSHHIMYSLNP